MRGDEGKWFFEVRVGRWSDTVGSGKSAGRNYHNMGVNVCKCKNKTLTDSRRRSRSDSDRQQKRQ